MINLDPVIPITCLTFYEKDYLKEGKLVALMNPQLLFILKDYIEKEKFSPKRAVLICETFYRGLLPDMEPNDYYDLIKYLWSNTHEVKKGGKHKQMKIEYPDGNVSISNFYDGIKQFILFYGTENVRGKKFGIRGNDFIVKSVPIGKEKIYEKIDDNAYFCSTGDIKDRLNILRAINKSLGERLKIDVV